MTDLEESVADFEMHVGEEGYDKLDVRLGAASRARPEVTGGQTRMNVVSQTASTESVI